MQQSIPKFEYPVGSVKNGRRVNNCNYCKALIAPEFIKEIEEYLFILFIQARAGLIRQQDIRTVHKPSRHGHALSFPS